MGKPGTKPGSTIISHGVGERYENQAILHDTIRGINYKPGTKLKIERGRHTHYIYFVNSSIKRAVLTLRLLTK